MSQLEIDLERRTLTVRSEEAAPRTLPLPPELMGELAGIENITRIAAFIDVARLRLTLTAGEHVDLQLRPDDASIEDLQAGRPIVYLDQNHWSLLSAARFGHRAVPAAVAAAGQLMQWANDGRVLVPASAAHFTETVPRYGIPRVASATAILQVSRGWQMRNPVHVRLEEIRRRLAGAVGDAREVFAPQADGFFSMRSDASRQASAATAARVLTAVPSIIALYDTLLETEAIPDHGAVAETAACAWAQKWASLATELHAHRESVSTVRRIVTAALIEDLIDDVIRAALAHGTTPEAGHRVPRGRR